MEQPNNEAIINCPTHGPGPGYVICTCVLIRNRPVAHRVKPTSEDLGEILCKRMGEHKAHELGLICHRCAVISGYVPDFTREIGVHELKDCLIIASDGEAPKHIDCTRHGRQPIVIHCQCYEENPEQLPKQILYQTDRQRIVGALCKPCLAWSQDMTPNKAQKKMDAICQECFFEWTKLSMEKIRARLRPSHHPLCNPN